MSVDSEEAVAATHGEDHGVVLYTKPDCVACNATKRAFTKLKIDYTEIDITDPKNVRFLDHVKQLGFSSAPVVETAAGKAWSGFRPDEIKAEARAQGLMPEKRPQIPQPARGVSR